MPAEVMPALELRGKTSSAAIPLLTEKERDRLRREVCAAAALTHAAV